MTRRKCPNCGAQLDVITDHVETETHPGSHILGTDLPRTITTRTFLTCSGCEYVKLTRVNIKGKIL